MTSSTITSSNSANSSSAINVVVVDDHAIFRSGLKADLDGRLRVVAEADTVESAVTAIRAHRPAVVLLDVHLPGGVGGGGAEVIAGCRDLLGGTRFLALSVSDSAEDVVTVIRAGARGYVTKTISEQKFPTPWCGLPAETLYSPRGWRGLCSMPSARAPWPPLTTSWTGCRPANSKSCG